MAIDTRQEGDIERHRAVTSFWKGNMMEETFGPKLKQMWEWYEVVARGVEPGSEAHECLERFVAAVDVCNDSMAQNDTDHIIKTFNTAIALLKDAALARPRR